MNVTPHLKGVLQVQGFCFIFALMYGIHQSVVLPFVILVPFLFPCPCSETGLRMDSASTFVAPILPYNSHDIHPFKGENSIVLGICRVVRPWLPLIPERLHSTPPESMSPFIRLISFPPHPPFSLECSKITVPKFFPSLVPHLQGRRYEVQCEGQCAFLASCLMVQISFLHLHL